jgi:hypothetical protein
LLEAAALGYVPVRLLMPDSTPPTPPLGDDVAFSGELVFQLLSAAFTGLLLESEIEHRLIVADTRYRSVSPEWLRAIAMADPVLDKGKYESDVFDCDDFCQYLRTKVALYAHEQQLNAPLAAGFLLTQKHAVNLCIDADQNVHILDTQSDERTLASDPTSFTDLLKLTPSNPIRMIYI